MALNAGRVGVSPDQVDVFGKISSDATGAYTKQEADAKFETQLHASSTYETKTEASSALAAKQPINLSVPIELLGSSYNKVEPAIHALADNVFDKGLLTSSNDLDDVTNTGIYRVRDSVPTNSPEGIAWYSLIVNQVNFNNIQQQVCKANFIYQRVYAGATPTWSAWYKITGTIVT